MSAQRDENGRWVAGTASPNPGGRPRVPEEVAEFLRSNSLAVTQRMYEIAVDPKTPPAIAVQAGELFLNRALGKAPTSLEVSGPGGAPLRLEEPLTRELEIDRARRIAFVLERGLRAQREIARAGAVDAEIVETRPNREPESDDLSDLL